MIASIQIYFLVLYHIKTLKLKQFSIDFIDLKTLNCCCTKTTYPIELKFTGLIERVNEDLYTNFQGILNFNRNL